MRKEVHFSTLNPDPHNVRSRLRKIKELADSIALHGLLENLVVIRMPVSVEGDERYLIKAGARRYAAIEQLVKSGRWNPDVQLVPVFIQEEDGGWSQLVENIQRDDPPVWDLGRRFSEYYEAGYKQEEIGARVGKGQGYISRCIQIAQGLAPETIELIVKNRFEFPDSTLLKLASLKDEHGFPDVAAQKDRAVLFGARRGRRKRAAPEKHKAPKDIVYRRYKRLKDQLPIPRHAEPYVEQIVKYLGGKVRNLNFEKCRRGGDGDE